MSEPVEYQYRTRPDWITEWNGWNTCSKESAEAYEKTPYLHDWHYEVRRLYTTPPQRTWVGLTPPEIEAVMRQRDYEAGKGGGLKKLVAITEAKLKEKNEH
jgi:hypothetical protein